MSLVDYEEVQTLRDKVAKLEAERDELVRAVQGEHKWERLNFIRDSAQLLYVFRKREPGSGFQPADAWTHARALWEAKPEDC